MDIGAWLEEEVRASTIPGATWLVRRAGQTLSMGAAGWADLRPPRRRARDATVYDLASLTKPLATAALAVLLSRDGVVSLDEPAGERLPALRRSPWADATLLDLLTHTSGLPDWAPLYLGGQDREAYLRQIAVLPGGGPGAVVYSDLGYLVAGAMLEQAAGASLAVLFHVLIARPLTGTATAGALPVRYLPPRTWLGRIAPTEADDQVERAMVAERLGAGAAQSYGGWRQGVVHGQVHDRNAAVLGGVAGHAGLFGSVAGVAALAEQFLPGSRLFTLEELALFVTPRTPPDGELRTVGFQVPAGEDGLTGGALSPRAFGHTGFTGTSVVVDPEQALVCVLLTNRIHPQAADAGIKPLRQTFHCHAARLAADAPGPVA